MTDESADLRKQAQALENLDLEYTRLKHLIDYAAQGNDLTRYMSMSVLYVDPVSRRVLDVNDAALELLGYPRARLLSLTIDDLELSIKADPHPEQSGVLESYFTGVYKHADGHQLTITVLKQSLQLDDRKIWYYRLMDTSLHRQVWYELQRREDNGFKFQQKLTLLNEITIELSRIDSFDELCYHVVKFGSERFGFDRLGLWLVDAEQGMMKGTYGIDENGGIRAEHERRWSYARTHVAGFVAGKTESALVFDHSPLYNEKSEIVQNGWQITVPIMSSHRCIAILAADNLLHSQPLKNYEPELLRLYGITVAHLMELSQSREQTLALRVEHERTQMLREFISNIGHDIRTPLSVINTRAYLLERVEQAEQRRVMSAGIQDQVGYISKMIDNMLELVSLQYSPTFIFAPAPIMPILISAANAAQPIATEKQILLEIDNDSKAVVSADVDYLQRAFSEIIKNAVQYTPPQGWVRITCSEYARAIGVRVQDSGIGMSKETLARAFDPLYRGDQARTDRRSGFGLAIAKAVIESHRGRIIVDTTPGIGSTFEVILPT